MIILFPHRQHVHIGVDVGPPSERVTNRRPASQPLTITVRQPGSGIGEQSVGRAVREAERFAAATAATGSEEDGQLGRQTVDGGRGQSGEQPAQAVRRESQCADADGQG